MGNEANGITSNVIRSCHKTIRIGMEDGVDSLSVPIATGILLHGLREREHNKM
jgi:tRNA G18 (ribose-2'-O)-methylase SpoU